MWRGCGHEILSFLESYYGRPQRLLFCLGMQQSLWGIPMAYKALVLHNLSLLELNLSP
jgi:hypothetical protein